MQPTSCGKTQEGSAVEGNDMRPVNIQMGPACPKMLIDEQANGQFTLPFVPRFVLGRRQVHTNVPAEPDKVFEVFLAIVGIYATAR